jgi:WD40 repeat protein
VSTTPESPYKGLAAFGDSSLDAMLFFGRERERDLVIANMTASRLTLLYGPTGVGKSSLLNAGVVRALRDDPESRQVALFNSWVDDRTDELHAAVAESAEGYVYLILDQFEEFFLYHDVDGPFGTELASLLGDRGVRVNVLLSLREDALAVLDAFKGRIANLYGNSLRLDHLDREAARAAVLGPLETFERLTGEHVGAEPDLVEAVLDEVATGRLELVEAGRGRQEGGTQDARIEAPFLQLVLERLWDAEREAGSDTLRLETLLALGGADAIVREHLDRALAGLGSEQKDVAASIFDRLVTPSGTKIAHRAADLAEYASVDEAELGSVLETLGHERILRAVDSSNGGGARYEIFHDVLADAVLAWRLERRLERERQEAARKHRRLLVIASAALIALALTAAVAVFALTQRSQARTQARRAHARELDANALGSLGTDPQQGLKDALSAAQLSPSGQAENVLRTTLLASRLRAVLPAGGPVTTALYSPGGHLILTASKDGKARIYDAKSQRLLKTLDAHSPLAGALFDPTSGRFVVTEGEDGAARLWLASSGKQLNVFMHRGPVRSATFSQGGNLLVTTGADRTARIWRLPTGTSLGVIHEPGAVLGAAFNHDGSEVVTRGTDRFARLYATNDGRPLRTFDQGGAVAVAKFSPQRNLLVTAGANKTARIWDPQTGRMLRELKGQKGRVLDADFSPDGSLLATVGSDGSARVWEFPSGQLLAVPLGHTNSVTSAKFSPDGYSLVTTSVDRTARVWQPDTGAIRAVLAGHTDSVTGAAFPHDGSAVVTASDDGTARVWDPRLEPELAPIVHVKGPLQAARLSPDGTRIVVAGPGRKATVRTATGRALRSFSLPAPAADAVFRPGGRLVAIAAGPTVVLGNGRTLRAPVAVDSVAVAPDGRVAAGTERGTVQIWDANGKPVREIRAGASGPVRVAFSPDGTRIATATRARVARVWNAGTGKLVLTLRGHHARLTSVRFSPDGSQLVTASFDHDARIWDTQTGRVVHVLRGHLRAVNDAEFSPDGRWVVTAGPTTAGLWDASTGDLEFFLRGHFKKLTSATFGPSSRRIVTASQDGTVRTYLCDVCGGLDSLVALAKARLAHSASLR